MSGDLKLLLNNNSVLVDFYSVNDITQNKTIYKVILFPLSLEVIITLNFL